MAHDVPLEPPPAPYFRLAHVRFPSQPDNLFRAEVSSATLPSRIWLESRRTKAQWDCTITSTQAHAPADAPYVLPPAVVMDALERGLNLVDEGGAPDESKAGRSPPVGDCKIDFVQGDADVDGILYLSFPLGYIKMEASYAFPMTPLVLQRVDTLEATIRDLTDELSDYRRQSAKKRRLGDDDGLVTCVAMEDDAPCVDVDLCVVPATSMVLEEGRKYHWQPLGKGQFAVREAAAVAWRDALRKNNYVDGQDMRNKWYECRIVAADKTTVTLHYLGWRKMWDAKVARASPKIQPLHSCVPAWREHLDVGTSVEFCVQVAVRGRKEEWQVFDVADVMTDAPIKADDLGDDAGSRAASSSGIPRVLYDGPARRVQLQGRAEWIDISSELLCQRGTHVFL
ncbi:Aste57867_24118 [Aphanomyces stellatus]|uniref:Aste57867_24118 protein n=1 Tax=Aphanomyces stellatus TaxID=120398 RepID=A0A485LQN3_9STRA|nr:hypothetical protein As57867_024044 [Aphanomyces stellatus]VFU00760.1 Aste57867_24118 [Aphanomyces stellatus]